MVTEKKEKSCSKEMVVLHQIHRSVLAGAVLTTDSRECAAVLSSQIAPAAFRQRSKSRAEDAAARRTMQSQEKDSPRETALLQLSLIKTMVAKTLCLETSQCIRRKCTEIVGILLEQTRIDSKIVSLLGCPDRLMAHLASKCMAKLVLFQLKEESKVNEVWLCACLEIFSHPAKDPSAEYLGCLLDVLKSIFRDRSLHMAESLPKLLDPLDATLESLYDFLLSPSSSHSCQSGSWDSAVVNNLSAFVDLLEVLVALRGSLQPCYRCQRSVFLKTSHVLQSVSTSVPYFIKKKLVLLLKKCLLSKTGEDLLPAPLPLQALRDLYSEGDMLALAQAVLQAVNSSWLQQICVERQNSYFGGTTTILEMDARASPDIGILRALSLALLKALEIQLQRSALEAGVKADLQNFMSRLMTFLQSYLQRPRLEHACEWISLIFIEQDDDMLEAVKTLLALYLECERFCDKPPPVMHLGEDDTSAAAVTHESGYNPHCLFLFFLSSIMFDSTVLLDFLISSETCFLEYFVRYLKLLKGHWPHFCHICKHFYTGVIKEPLSVCEARASKPESSSGGTSSSFPETDVATPLSLTPAQKPLVTVRKQKGMQSVKPSQSDTSSLGALQSLVDYDSSEESEVEMLERECEPNIKQSYARHSKIRKAGSRDEGKEVDRPVLGTTIFRPKACPVPSFQQKPCDDGTSSEELLFRSVQCLDELQRAVSRLHRRNLFPYNPSALLKLLVHIHSLAREAESAVKGTELTY
ncbi:protein Lines homolog 1 [Microcaecilia unicolor]|uniref:Protein Lines homolog 1 n=1 Tax=Microcaecilia unicolor TaxID=1415580 RepID=A0A6P7WQX2_9AMPH|nr:protein Lines homolog 1 [Microcaecilia unicolor]